MQQWLLARGERVPEPGAHEAMHEGIAGMATPEQMAELAGSKGVAFDRLFLELMIAHHEGAVTMVEKLLEQPGSAYDPVLLEFTTDVTNDQTAEIERMNTLLVGLSPDPRAGLEAGLYDAGQAMKNMQLLASLPRPPGFVDPRNPAELPSRLLKAGADEDTGQEAGRDREDPPGEEDEDERIGGLYRRMPGDKRTALFRIDVIEIPIDNPASARIVDSPAVFADPETGTLAGLWRGGDHGEDSQETSRTDRCHDITVFPERGIAAGACAGNGILFDTSDPLDPQRIDAVVDEGFAYWHSATFNNDGTKVLFTDEWGGGDRARCRAYDPLTWGANAIYDIVDDRLEFRSHYKMPAPQVEQENCVAHNGSIVPVPGRDIFVQAWYQGGISVIDFTDSESPAEIAFFDRGPIDAEDLVFGGYWSAYWYQGRIYGTETVRGLDVLALVPGDHLTGNEIAAAELADQGPRFNPQQQFPVTWPAEPVVARVYLDQLARSDALRTSTIAELGVALDQAAERLGNGARDERLAGKLESLASVLDGSEADAVTTKRLDGLKETIAGIAGRLREAQASSSASR